jgi:hypothetical protein
MQTGSSNSCYTRSLRSRGDANRREFGAFPGAGSAGTHTVEVLGWLPELGSRPHGGNCLPFECGHNHRHQSELADRRRTGLFRNLGRGGIGHFRALNPA